MPGYRFGKHPPQVDYRSLRLSNYLTAALPPPPPSSDTLARVYAELKVSDPTTLFPMDGNDTLGDCTCAALAHAITVNEGLLGVKRIMPKAQVVKLYMHLTGGVDSGLNELNVLNYWRQNKVESDKIVAYATIAPKNHTHVQQAIELFGGVYLGFQVQPGIRRPSALDPRDADQRRPCRLRRGLRPDGGDGADLGQHAAGDLGLVGRVRR